MLSKILSATLIGIDAHVIDVEVDITNKGLPHFSTVGLPDAAVKESNQDRVKEYRLQFSSKTDNNKSRTGRYQERRVRV